MDYGVLVHINVKIWLKLTTWKFWRRRFNAMLVGELEYESLQRLPYAFKPAEKNYLTGKDQFVSWVCPRKEIAVIPTTAGCGVEFATITTPW